MEEKELEIGIDCGNEDQFYQMNGGAKFGIAFDKIFEKQGIEKFNNFTMTAKRNFKNLVPMIVQTYEDIFVDDGGRLNDDLQIVLFKILNAKSIIMTNIPYPYESFLKLIDDVVTCGDNALLKALTKYIDDNFTNSLDSATEERIERKKKINNELMMNDVHGKAIVKLAYLYRILIPIIGEYFYYNKHQFVLSDVEEDEDSDEEIEFDDVNSQIFAYIFDNYTDNPEALKNKLYRITESRVVKTAFSDKRFWSMAKMVAVTKETETLEIYKKILTNAIPKIVLDENVTNIVGFFQAVVHNQVDFLLQKKFKHKINVIEKGDTSKTSTEDETDEMMSELERVESLHSKSNEGSYIIRKMNIADIIITIPKKLDVSVEDAEVKDFLTKINRNSIQENIVSMIVLKYFNDRDALKFINFYDYAFLVLACKKYLIKHQFKYLPMILTAKCEKHKERASICGKKVRPEILRSKKYFDLFTTKYHNFVNNVDRPFLAAIGTTYSSNFRDENDEDLFDSSVKVSKIAEEMIDLAYLV